MKLGNGMETARRIGQRLGLRRAGWRIGRVDVNRPTAIAVGAGVAALGAIWLARRVSRYSFAGKVAVIAGGSRGLGLVLARRLAREGASVVLLARDAAELDRARSELEAVTPNVLTIPCDVTNREAVQKAIDEAASKFGRIDILINNAGTIQVGPVENMTIRDFEDAMAVHVYAPLYASLAAAPHMRRQGSGRIVNISSIGGKIAVPHLLPYCTSKFALVGLSDGLRAELRKDNIYVTTVCPGLMRTGSPPNALFKGQHEKEYAWFAVGDAMPGSSMSAEWAARRILEACRRGAARLIVGGPAKMAWLGYELMPGVAAAIGGLVNRVLPEPTQGSQTRKGWESRGKTPSVLTMLSDWAARRNNEAADGMKTEEEIAH